ncbi:hypothetical protein BG003_003300 [Podila horticola]|nr:hypothetical protein BG003_003300 [Podila horticola]
MDSMGTTLRQVFPNLRKLGFSYEFSDLLPMEKVLPSLTGLSSLSLTFVNRTSTFPLLLSTQSDALSSLTIFKEISMADFFSLVTRCPNLQDLKVSVLQHVEGPKVSPPWICKDLRKLDIHLEHRDNSYYMYDDEANGPTIEQEIASAKRLAPSLLQQLGEMTHLQDLCLGFNHEYSVGEWTFFQVSTDPVYGLPRLAGLQQLKAFKVTGVEHNAGQDEIEWMRTHWPLLVSLDMPILVKVNGRRRQARGDKFDGLAPAYEKWYPGLKVLIPESSYGCSMCLALYCDYSDQGTMYDYSPVGMSQVLEPQEREGEDEDEHEETIWALDDEYHLSKHYNVHKSEAWPKYSRRQMQCGHRY